MTLAQALEAIERGETFEQYKAQINRLNHLVTERDFLKDALDMFKDDPHHPTAIKKRKRLNKVLNMIEELK